MENDHVLASVGTGAHTGLVRDREVDPDLRVGKALVHIREGSGNHALHRDIAYAGQAEGLIAVEHQDLDLH